MPRLAPFPLLWVPPPNPPPHPPTLPHPRIGMFTQRYKSRADHEVQEVIGGAGPAVPVLTTPGYNPLAEPLYDTVLMVMPSHPMAATAGDTAGQFGIHMNLGPPFAVLSCSARHPPGAHCPVCYALVRRTRTAFSAGLSGVPQTAQAAQAGGHDPIYGIPQDARPDRSRRPELTRRTLQDAEAVDGPGYELPTLPSPETAVVAAALATEQTGHPIPGTPQVQDDEAAAADPGNGGGDALATADVDINGSDRQERPGEHTRLPMTPQEADHDGGDYVAIRSLHTEDKDRDFRAKDGSLMQTGVPPAAHPGSAKARPRDSARTVALEAERAPSAIVGNPFFAAAPPTDTIAAAAAAVVAASAAAAAAAPATPCPVALIVPVQDDDSGSDYDNVDERGLQSEPFAVDDGGEADHRAMVESPDSPSGTTV